MQNLTSLDVLEDGNLSCASRMSSKAFYRTFLICECRQDDNKQWRTISKQGKVSTTKQECVLCLTEASCSFQGGQHEKEMSYFDPVSTSMHKWQKLEKTVVNG